MAATDPTTDHADRHLDGALTISRRSGGDSERIMLRIHDRTSRGTIAELELSPHQFAMAITGRAEVEALSTRVWPAALERLGMVRQNTDVDVEVDDRMRRLRNGSWREALTALTHTQHPEMFRDDWRPFALGDGYNKHRHDSDAGTYRVSMERWVEA